MFTVYFSSVPVLILEVAMFLLALYKAILQFKDGSLRVDIPVQALNLYFNGLYNLLW